MAFMQKRSLFTIAKGFVTGKITHVTTFGLIFKPRYTIMLPSYCGD